MSLVVEKVPDLTCPKANINCGVIFCFNENDYLISPGTKSNVDILFGGLFGTTPFFEGDRIAIDGFVFTLTATPTTATEVLIGVDAIATAANFLAKITAIQFFIDNYDISVGAIPNERVLTIVNKVEKLDENFFIKSFALSMFPAPTTLTPGTDPVYKSDYYVFATVTDNDNGKVICADFNLPLNIFEDGISNKVCFDLAGLIKDYIFPFTSDPDPSLPVLSIDPNQYREFSMNIQGSYKDPDADCGKIKTNFFDFSPIRFVNFIEQVDGKNFLSFCAGDSIPSGIMSDLPTNETVCPDVHIEFRYYWFGAGFPLFVAQNLTYTDGTNAGGIDTIITPFTEEIYVYSPDFSTLNFPAHDPSKTPAFLSFTFFTTVGGSPVTVSKEFTVFYDTSTNGKCCNCHKAFYFQGETGNNDLVIGKCDSSIEIDVSFLEACKVQECGEFTGGRRNLAQKEKKVFFSSWIEYESIDYIEKFLSSPIKFMIEGNAVFAIVPAEESFTIFKRNKKNLIRFKYYKSLVDRNYTLK